MSSPETVFGMSLAIYTLGHVLISLVGIGSGLVVLFGLVAAKRLEGWTAVFLATTVATSVTGFGFPFDHLRPSQIVGFISLVVLAIAVAARYAFHLRGAWRPVYVACAALALYLNVFVGVVQSFLKIPVLKALAPKQTEPPFVVSQGIVLGLFVVLAIVAAIRFRAERVGTDGAGTGGR
ncbi:MAG: hypothetical protein DMF81_19760 [Acidobacteria bacterium]|nr:MAG: hypothetical protein DMF81_19760 [Acidobacteriota bacterium]